MPIPASVDELTPEWFSAVLGADVGAVEVVDAHSGTTGRARVRLTAGDSVPDTVFVKLQPFTPEQRTFVRTIGMGVAEARLYATVGHELPVRVPRVWHAAFADEDDSFIMVLEDLVASGCRFPKPGDDDVLSVAESLVDEFAALHAAYWAQELPWLGTQAVSARDGQAQEQRMAGGAALVQSAVDQFADELPPAFRAMGELYVARYRDIGVLFNEGERTLIHGDSHMGNLFVDGSRTGSMTGRWPAARPACATSPTS
jgi:hypothetical protein